MQRGSNEAGDTGAEEEGEEDFYGYEEEGEEEEIEENHQPFYQ
jgi:hypothetical protein